MKRRNRTELKREEILELARQAKPTILDGGFCCLNDMATVKELLNFVRMIEERSREKRQAGQTA